MAKAARVIRWFAILKKLWSRTRDLPVREINISNIAYHGDYFWKGEQGFGILEVLNNPLKFQGLYSNIQDQSPRDLVMLDTNMVPIDGVLVVGKVLELGFPTVRAIVVPRDWVEEIAPGFDDPKFRPKHRCRQCGDIATEEGDSYLCGEERCIGPQD
jgi:hypothetical protein